MGGLCCVGCGILVPRPGFEPGPLAVKAQSPNHWTSREVPKIHLLTTMKMHALRPPQTQNKVIQYCSLYIRIYLSIAGFFIEGKTLRFYWQCPIFFLIKTHCISCHLGLPVAPLSDSPLSDLCDYLRYL